MSISVEEVKTKVERIKGLTTNSLVHHELKEFEQQIIDQLTSNDSLMTGHHVKVFKFLDSIKYVLSKHTGGDRKIKALRDDVKRIISETFGDY